MRRTIRAASHETIAARALVAARPFSRRILPAPPAAYPSALAAERALPKRTRLAGSADWQSTSPALAAGLSCWPAPPCAPDAGSSSTAAVRAAAPRRLTDRRSCPDCAQPLAHERRETAQSQGRWIDGIDVTWVVCPGCLTPFVPAADGCPECGQFVCPGCLLALAAGQSVCRRCGDEISAGCPSCRAAIPAGAPECARCGQALCPACAAAMDANDSVCACCGAEASLYCTECGVEVGPRDSICPARGAVFDQTVLAHPAGSANRSLQPGAANGEVASAAPVGARGW